MLTTIATYGSIILGAYAILWLAYYPVWSGQKPFLRSFVIKDEVDTVWARLQEEDPNKQYRRVKDTLYMTETIFGEKVETVFDILPTNQPFSETLRVQRSMDKDYPFGEDSWISVAAQDQGNGRTMVVAACKTRHKGLWGMVENLFWLQHVKKMARRGYANPSSGQQQA